MAIPDYQSLMLPVLKYAAAGEVRIGDIVERLANGDIAGAERLMLEHIGSVESALGKSMPDKTDAREKLRATLAPVSRLKLVHS